MVKFNTFTLTKAPWRNSFANVKDLKNLKYTVSGKSGLPVEMPLISNKDKKVAAMMQDSFNFERAKDSIIIAQNYSKK